MKDRPDSILSLYEHPREWFIFWTILFIVVSMFLWSFDIFGNLINPGGSGPSTLVSLVCLLNIGKILIPILLVGLIFHKTRSLSFEVIVIGITFVVIFLLVGALYGPIAGKIADRIEMNTLIELMVAKKDPVIAAIEEYDKVNGFPPESLQELSPKYIKKIPDKIGGFYFHYSYKTKLQGTKWEGNAWILEVRVPVRWLDDAVFVYVPNQSYPEDVEVIDGWGFLGIH